MTKRKIHHADGNPTNNILDNLVVMDGRSLRETIVDVFWEFVQPITLRRNGGPPFCPTCNAPVTGNKQDGYEYRG